MLLPTTLWLVFASTSSNHLPLALLFQQYISKCLTPHITLGLLAQRVPRSLPHLQEVYEVILHLWEGIDTQLHNNTINNPFSTTTTTCPYPSYPTTLWVVVRRELHNPLTEPYVLMHHHPWWCFSYTLCCWWYMGSATRS